MQGNDRVKGEARDDEVCGLCGKVSVDDDMFCFGCDTFICPHCDSNGSLMGQHYAVEHWEDANDK